MPHFGKYISYKLEYSHTSNSTPCYTRYLSIFWSSLYTILLLWEIYICNCFCELKESPSWFSFLQKWMKSENDAQCLIWGELLQRQRTPWRGSSREGYWGHQAPSPRISPETALSISAPGHHSFGLVLTCVCALSQFISFCASVSKICPKVTVSSLYTVSALGCFIGTLYFWITGDTCIS